MVKSEVLLESKTLRDACANRVDVLNKVKALALLPDDIHATVEQVATYYEVSKKAIDSLILDNRTELEEDGLRKTTKDELISLKEMGVIPKNTASLIVIPRRAILRIGFLLRDSEVAKQVRTYALDVEEVVRNAAPQVALDTIEARKLEIQWLRAEAQLRNAKARQAKLLAEIATKYRDRLSNVAVEAMLATSSNLLLGQEVVPLPTTEKTYTATEIGELAGVSANKVGSVANKLGLKTAEYGIWVMDKSRYSDKQMPNFRYNEHGKERLLEYFRQQTGEGVR